MKEFLESDLPALSAALQCLREGGVLMLPTETVYGLVTRWDNPEGRERIYAMKHRPASKLLQMMTADLSAAYQVGILPSHALERLATHFWPGPLTVVAKATLPPEDSPLPKQDSIGLRIPNHPFLLELMRQANCALAATSANRSGTPAAVNYQDALAGLAQMPDLAVDAGVITVTDGAASTVVSLLENEPVILRQGTVSLQEIREAIC